MLGFSLLILQAVNEDATHKYRTQADGAETCYYHRVFLSPMRDVDD